MIARILLLAAILASSATAEPVDRHIIDAAYGIPDEAGSIGMMAIGRDAAEKPAEQLRATERSKHCRALATGRIHP